MLDNHEWRRQLESISQITQITNTWGNVNEALRSFHSQLDMYQSMKDYDFSKIFAMQDMMKTYDFSKVYEVQNTMKDYDFSAAASAIRNFSQMDDAWISASAALRAYDMGRFDTSFQEAWRNINWSEVAQVSDIVEEVAEQYIEDNQLDEEASEEIREVAGEKDGRHLTEKQKKVWEVYIFPILLSLIFYILGLKENQPVAVSNITEINYHYTVEVGMEVDTLNAYNFRMICKDDVKARKKPDCSSQVTGHLPLGKVVCVVNKYKKWLEITWQDE
ncbi:MAG: hypothetical protein ACI4C5_08470, partial [Lachnospiraceae bacterium]